MPVFVNFVAFQASWFACVLGGAAQLPWLGVIAVAATLLLHGWQSPEHRPELYLALCAGALGALWESGLVASGLLVYPSGQLFSALAPVWIVALWIGFATSFNVSMRWLKGRPALAAMLGAIFGPMSFWGGAKLGAVAFPDPVLALSVLSAGWGLLMPLMVVLADRFDGWHPDPEGART
ncbi:MAG: DUF2878 domain-containing protein [Pseudomonadales bacterium]|jgi:hypothetical protein|nr:DUF2878 domain-containing protein [Pseudomonadales bacterium]